MSIVSYNNVTLPYANITSFTQQVVYDEIGETDWYCTKFDIVCNCVLNVSYMQAIDSTLAQNLNIVNTINGGANAATVMDMIRVKLLRPRRQLSIKFNGIELIPKIQTNRGVAIPGTVDAKNGPKPQYCKITQLTNELFLVQYHIIAHYWENTSSDRLTDTSREGITNPAGGTVLYNRWTETVDIDGLDYSKRTREGQFMIRSDNVNGSLADQVRANMAVVSLPANFLRESATYTISPDGLSIKYRVVDKEVFKTPPRESFRAKGMYHEENQWGDKGIRRAMCKVDLEGSNNTNQLLMLGNCIGVVASKVLMQRISVLENVTLEVDMYNNRVSVAMTAMLQSPRRETRTLSNGRNIAVPMGADLAFMVATPGSRFPSAADATGNAAPRIPPYNARGTARLLLLAAKYYDPSLNLPSNQLGSENNIGPGANLQVGQSSINTISGLDIGKAGSQREA